MKLLLTLSLTFLVFFAPVPALAQDDVSPDGIYTGGGFVPCGQTAATPCNSCHIVILANTITKWLIGIAFMFFAVLAVIAGFKLVTAGGRPGALQDAKNSFTNAFIGLFIILGAWLLVDTLLRGILKGGDGELEGYGPWSEVKCATETKSGIAGLDIDEADFTPVPYEEDNEVAGASTVTGTAGTSVAPVSRNGMVSLKASGVNVARWKGTGYGPGGAGRTDLVHPTVAQAVLQMQNTWKNSHNGKLPFQVTAAYTENVGHSANSQHYKGTAVDLQPTPGGASYNEIIQLCRQAGFTFVNDERSANHIHCDMR